MFYYSDTNTGWADIEKESPWLDEISVLALPEGGRTDKDAVIGPIYRVNGKAMCEGKEIRYWTYLPLDPDDVNDVPPASAVWYALRQVAQGTSKVNEDDIIGALLRSLGYGQEWIN